MHLALRLTSECGLQLFHFQIDFFFTSVDDAAYQESVVEVVGFSRFRESQQGRPFPHCSTWHVALCHCTGDTQDRGIFSGPWQGHTLVTRPKCSVSKIDPCLARDDLLDLIQGSGDSSCPAVLTSSGEVGT